MKKAALRLLFLLLSVNGGYGMRVDKYLKNSRLIKRRTIAKEACDQSRILINGKPAKPGSEVKLDDIVTIQFGNSVINARVKNLSDHTSKDLAETMYEIIDDRQPL